MCRVLFGGKISAVCIRKFCKGLRTLENLRLSARQPAHLKNAENHFLKGCRQTSKEVALNHRPQMTKFLRVLKQYPKGVRRTKCGFAAGKTTVVCGLALSARQRTH